MVEQGNVLVAAKADSCATAATNEDVDWAAVYEEYLPRVYDYLRFRTGDNTLAEELTAQTFEKAWRGRHRYRFDLGAFSTWLFAIARNTAVTHYRKRYGSREVPLDSVEAGTSDRGTCIVEEIVERQCDLARLHALLSRLDSRERELVELKYGAALTNRAIARLTGLSESNVGTLLHRTVLRLREAWYGEGVPQKAEAR